MPTKLNEDRLGELLLRWDELRRQGRDVTARELCTDCPELVEGLARRIEAVRKVDSVLDIEDTAGLSTPGDRDPNGASANRELPDAFRASAEYRPRRHHAHGGLGEIIIAYQKELDRPVALKRIRPDKLHDAARHRFLREAAITARLQHPGIVPIYGLGQDDDGPFYTMPFIQGQTLQEAIDGFQGDDSLGGDPGRRSLKFRGLLQQFITVCNTVAYAHDRGIVHRDLKPSNIMLGPYGETLVMDWGLAKRLERDGSVSESEEDAPSPSSSPEDLTADGIVLGTPRYMSPEQAKGQPAGPASDIFSLGLILYAILTGKSAFDEASLRSADSLKAVREAAVVPPRRRDPSVPQALEAICLKALSVGPEDRYPSARTLAEDVTRWLADEPVSAWREPFLLRTRRWMRQHRTLVMSTAAVLIFGMAGLAGFTTIVAEKNRELDARNTDLDRQRQAALSVLDLFQMVVAAARPKDLEGGLGIDATIRAAVDAAEPGIGETFDGKPTVEASIRNTLGESYYYLGDFAPAIRQFVQAVALRRQSLGADDPDTLGSINNLAEAYHEAGRVADALPLLEDLLKRRQATLGPDDSRTLSSMNNLAGAYHASGRLDEALSLYEETLKRLQAKFGADNSRTLLTMGNLAMAYLDAGRSHDAVPLLEEALKRTEAKLGPDNPDTLILTNGLASAYWDAGRLPEGLPLYEETLKWRKATLGPDHPHTLNSMNNLATAYQDDGRIAQALLLLEETLKRRKAKLGLDHPDTLQSMGNLALAYQDARRLAEALPLLEEAQARGKAGLGADHPVTLRSMSNLARAYLAGNPAQAEPLIREALAIREQKTPDDWRTSEVRSLLGGSLSGQKKYAEAEPLLLQAYTGMKTGEAKVPSASKRLLAEAGTRIVEFYVAWGKKDEAEEWRKKLPPAAGAVRPRP